MVDNENDHKDPNNLNNNFNNHFVRPNFDDRFSRPINARGIRPNSRSTPTMMMRPGIRPPFNNRFDTFPMPNRPEMHHRPVNCGQMNEKIDNRDMNDNNFRAMPPRDFFNRPQMQGRCDIRQPVRDFHERNIRDRPPFPGRFPPPRENQPFHMPPRLPNNMPNRMPQNRFQGMHQRPRFENNNGNATRFPSNDTIVNENSIEEIKNIEKPMDIPKISDSQISVSMPPAININNPINAPNPMLTRPVNFERPNMPIMERNPGIQSVIRPPPQFNNPRMPPNFGGLPGMPNMSNIPNMQNVPNIPKMPHLHNVPNMANIPTMPPNMPPFNQRPEMFDPHMRFHNPPPQRPDANNPESVLQIKPAEPVTLPPPFRLPTPFRPPFAHMPPPMMNQAPPLPMHPDPNFSGNKVDKPLTLATLNEQDVWVQNPTSDGRIYYYQWKTRQTTWDRPQGVKIIIQSELDSILANKNPATISSAPVQLVIPNIAPQPTKPPEVVEWNEYKAPDGRPYFHNRRTAVTTWEKPHVLIDWENKINGVKPAEPAPNPEKSISKSTEAEENKVDDSKDESSDESNDEGDEDEESTENSKARDKSKPISSTPVSGTPWCIVWTGDGRVFFFNPAKRLSVWDRPDDLKDRSDVDKILLEPPKQVSEKSEKNDAEKPAAIISVDLDEPPAKKQKINSNEEEKAASDSSEENEDEKEDNSASQNDLNDSVKDSVPLTKEAAKEAEEKASKERALLPMDVRVAQFREMLIEKQVSAFSTWEKELHKIVFDPRYLLLASKERKVAFENYVKERAEEERREKKNQVRENKDLYKKLLKEANLNHKSSYSDFSSKYSKDERFKAIDKARDRETMFQDFINDLRKKDKEDKHKDKDKVKQNFMMLLKENKIYKTAHWGEAKKKIDSDPRYKAAESSKREEWYKEFVKKNKTNSRENSETKRDRERKERQEASIREREKEVKESLSTAMRDRDKERDYHLKSEAEQSFKVLLTDFVKNPDDSWKEVKRLLRKEVRWTDISDKLERSIRDSIFKEHISSLKKKTKKK